MPVVGVEWHTVVAVPCVKDGLELAMRDGPGLVEGGLSVVGLPNCVLVERLEVDCPPWFAGRLGDHHHAVTPCDWRAHWHWLDHLEADVLVEAGLHVVLPVHRDRQWVVICDGIS